MWGVFREIAIWRNPIVAGFIGAFGVHVLTQSRDREKWILDSKKQEFKELVTALAQSHTAILDIWVELKPIEPDELRTLRAAQNIAITAFRDRVYIRKELSLTDLSKRWLRAMQQYEQRLATQPLHDEFEAIRDEIVAAADHSVPKTFWQRLMLWKD
jgi:hypothetical protein